MNSIKTSVALCTFNGDRYLSQQLDSIINQSVKVDEIIICDDSSSDNTINILKQYAKNFPNLISIHINETTLKTVKNFEKAISLTKGDLIFLSDQDDIWVENKVETIVDYFKNINEFKLLFTNGDLIDEEGEKLNTTLWDEWGFTSEKRKLWLQNDNAFKDLILNKNKITGATVCFNKSIKNKAIPITTPTGYWHDSWLGLHAAAGNGLFFLEKNLILYRIHDKQQVGISSNLKKAEKPEPSPDSICKKEFYSIVREMYPSKVSLFPQYKKENRMIVFFSKVKNKLRPFYHYLKRIPS